MLFVVEYSLEWDDVEIAAAKRLDWGDVCPETFRFVGEYIWHSGEPPFRGFAVVEAESIEDLHAFVLHYGSTLEMHIHPATDVMGGIEALGSMEMPSPPPPKKPAKPKKAAKKKKTRKKK